MRQREAKVVSNETSVILRSDLPELDKPLTHDTVTLPRLRFSEPETDSVREFFREFDKHMIERELRRLGLA